MNRREHTPRPEHAPVPPVQADPPVTENPAVAEKSLLEQSLEATEAARRAPPPIQKPVGFRPEEISALINAEVVARHADEAPFLWLLRDRAVVAPHYSLHDLAKLDERVEANLDGLRVAGDYGWRLSKKALDWEEPGEVFAACLLALENRSPDRLDPVLAVACKSLALQRGLISAAGWTPFETIQPILQSWLSSDVAALRRIGLAAHAVHRQDPGKPLVSLLHDDDATVRTRALKAAAELGRVDLLPLALHARADRDASCRFQAAWAAARLGDRSEATIQALMHTTDDHQERALAMVLRCLPITRAVDHLRTLWKDRRNLRLAAVGTGAVGDPALVDVLIEWMEIEDVARVAGEAFSMITGADLAYLDLDRDPPEHAHEHEKGDDVPREDLGPDSDLPYPSAERVAEWWRRQRENFIPGLRYLCGLPIEPENLKRVLWAGKQRQRAAAALELALRDPIAPLFNVCARGDLQERSLAAWTS